MTEKNTAQQNVSLLGLVALTVTTVIGAGVFNLPRDLAKSVAPGPALIALVFASIAFAVFVYCLKYLQFSLLDYLINITTISLLMYVFPKT